MMKVPSLGGTENIIRKDNMRVIKDLDPAIELEPIANALIKGHVVKGITECADNDPDLFCVTREQRSTRDLVRQGPRRTRSSRGLPRPGPH